MKISKIIAAGAIVVSGIAVAAGSAAAEPNQQACFGQGRAAYSSANGGTAISTGKIISGRAHDGTNVQQNSDYKAACQAA